MIKDLFFISDAQLEDIPYLVRLLNQLFNIEQDFTPNSKLQEAGLGLLIKTPNSAIIKVARTQSGEVIGMVSAQLVISSAQGSYSAWVEDMVVDEAYRMHGIGRQLLSTALVWAKDKGATRAQLLVDLDNEPALGYYDHLGWESSRMGMRRLILK
jgi:ribosomal protein S18 acetylase RimI-like enzyme